MGDLLVVASCNGMVRALEKNTGRVKWEYDIGKDGQQTSFHGDPLVTDQLVVIGADGSIGHIYAFDRRTGAVRWKYRVDQRGVASDVLRLGNNAYAVTLGDELLCLDLATGKAKWTFHSGISPRDFHWTSTPSLTAERIYFAGLDGVIYALDPQSGKQVWKKDLGARVTTSVALRGNDLYAGTEKRRIYRIDAISGEVLSDFEVEAEPRGHITMADDSLLVFLGDEILVNLDLSLKRMKWSAEASKEWTSARPYLWHGTVLAGNRRELVALRSADGTQVWSHQFPETVRGIGTSEELLYVGSLKGPVFAYAPKREE